MAEKKRIVVIGGGLAGLRIAQQLGKRKEAQITLISERESFVFFPRLTEVLSGARPKEQCMLDLKTVFTGELLIDSANLVNPAEKSIVLDSGRTVEYDVLVIATGSGVNFFSTPGSQYSYPFYSPDDLERLSKQVEIMLAGDEQKGTHVFAVVGGGPTGVEVAYALAQRTRTVRPGAKVMVLEAGPEILKNQPEKLRAAVASELEKAGVEILTDTLVTEITPMALTVRRGESKDTIPCYTTVWAAGSKPRTLAITGIEYSPKGEVPVRPTLQTQTDSSIFAVGDCAATGTPKTAQSALQQADTAIANVNGYLEGKKLQPFTYNDKGTMIALDKETVASVYGNVIKGFLARQLRETYYKVRFSQYK